MKSKKNNIHDKSYKDLFSNKETFLNLIQSFVSDTWGSRLNKENLVLVNKSYVLADYEELGSDIVYKAEQGAEDVYFYLLLEFQSSVDYRMPIRLLLYMNEIWRDVLKDAENKNFRRKSFKLPAIVPIVLYNGAKRWTASKSLKDVISNSEVFGENILDFKYILLDINRYDKGELYKKDNISSAIFLLDQNIDRIEFYNRLKDILIGFNKLTVEEKLQLKHWLVNANLDEENFKGNIEKIFSASKGEVLQMTSNISKGLEKLKEEGIKEGAKEKAYEIAKKAIQKGLDDESISELTGLSIKQIEELKETIK